MRKKVQKHRVLRRLRAKIKQAEKLTQKYSESKSGNESKLES